MNFDTKHAPKVFGELVFANDAAREICEGYVRHRPHKHLMLWGPAGTGKTATARVIVQSRYRTAQFFGAPIEYNGADFTKDTFDKLYGDLNYLSFQTNDPMVVINEFDEMNRDLQAKFRAWMDKWPMMKFVVTTNEKPGVHGVTQKIMPSLLSRFTRVELSPPSLDDWLPRAQSILAAEGHMVSLDDLRLLLGTYTGDVRDMLPTIEMALASLQPPPAVQAKSKPVLQVVSSNNAT